MQNPYDIQFGRLTPTPQKIRDNDRYQLRRLGLSVPSEPLEKEIPYPADLISWYNQGSKSACVGYSCSWMMSTINSLEIEKVVAYDALWLYYQAQAIDEDPTTTPEADNGTYIWAAMDTLRLKGHKRDTESSPRPENGIQSFYWLKSIDDIRTAFLLDRPAVFGIPWYTNFNSPELYKDEYWIGRKSNWGKISGGHAIFDPGLSDSREAVRLLNSWGEGYPPVWISYKSIERLLKEDGECATVIDKVTADPEPDLPDEIKVTAAIGEYGYRGIARKVAK